MNNLCTNILNTKRRVAKIALLTPSNVAGGAERVLTSLANQFAAIGIDTYFIQFDYESEFYSLNRNVKKIKIGVNSEGKKGLTKWLLFPKYYYGLNKKLEKIKPDAVISFLFLTNVIAAACCKRLHIPLILSERNDPDEYGTKEKKVMKLLYPLATGFVCQSDIIKSLVEERYSIKNATVIANPLNKTQVAATKKDKIDKIMSVGRLIPQKNFGLLIDAFSDFVKEYPQYRLVIFGEGPLRGELEEQIKKLGIRDRVELPGIVKDAIKINNDARLFILSSRFEGYPNVLAEAMANGIICIASDVASGTVRQLITHEENGYIYPVGDKEKMLACMKNAMMNSNRLDDMSSRAQKIYERTSIESIANEWLCYVDEILGKSFRTG